MRLMSTAFSDGAAIPRRFTCDGKDVSPALQWSAAPVQAVSFVLLCDDPDAPAGVWRHWAVYDIPGDQTALAEGAGRPQNVQDFKQASNDFGRLGYGGPCPPRRHGPHHYHFRLLALSQPKLPIRSKDPSCEEVEREAREYALDEAVLVGVYGR
ncbi:MAG: YbhB/YbcL family Raf kinase inhibitor-like protein [Methylocystis sp.]